MKWDDSNRCKESHGVPEWPYLARCILELSHDDLDGHEDHVGRTWHE